MLKHQSTWKWGTVCLTSYNLIDAYIWFDVITFTHSSNFIFLLSIYSQPCFITRLILRFQQSFRLGLLETEIIMFNTRDHQWELTLGRLSIYVSGISISARTLLFIAMAALWIWLAQSLFSIRCFLDLSERPPGRTQGTGSHHLPSFLGNFVRNEAPRNRLEFPGMFSAYQNSVSLKVSNISWKQYYVNSFSHKKSWWKLRCYKQEAIEICLTMSIVSSFCSAGRLT